VNNRLKSITAVSLLCATLMLFSGYIVQLQNWLVFATEDGAKASENNVLGVSSSVGLRSIISANSVEVAEPAKMEPLVSVENLTVSSGLNLLQTPAGQNGTLEFSPEKVNELFKPAEENTVVNVESLPMLVEFEDEIMVEFPADYSHFKMQKALSRLLVMSEPLSVDEMLSTTAIPTAKKPFLYKKVFDENDKAVRYPAQAYRYANHLLLNESEQVEDEQGKFVLVRIPLKQYEMPQKVEKYHHWVTLHAKQHRVEPELVMAIIDVESRFNHKAVSPSNALGLMQIKANAAGRDVYRLVDGRAGQPDRAELFDPQNNIRMGTAYIGLLQNNYLQKVRDPNKKEMLTISSYNGGIATVLSLFGKTPELAIQQINRLHPTQVYRTLRYKHQSDETRQYLEKVLKAKAHYQNILEMVA